MLSFWGVDCPEAGHCAKDKRLEIARWVSNAAKVDIPRDATRIAGSGKFLIPGLWDMHSHHQATGADWEDLFVAKGVVGTRDMGSDADFILPSGVW